MATAQILAVCQSGGEFVREKDGTLTYSGGEAHAIDIDREMSLENLKTEVSNMFQMDIDIFSIKYFLPNNKRTLITVSSDKDLQRMVDYHTGSATTDVYVMKKVDNRIIPSVVADSAAQTDAIAVLATPSNDSKRRKISSDWDSIITGAGQLFDSANAFRDALDKYAVANSFKYRFKTNEGARVTAECTGEGCPWRIFASKKSSTQEFVVKKMSDNHTCERKLDKGHRLASKGWVASVIKDKLRDTPNYKPKDIAVDLQQEYGLSLNYAQAWRGMFVAKKLLHNSHEEACNQLPWFCERIIETNPGSLAILVKTDDSKFRVFVAFHACLSGFVHGCRPLLFLDGFSIKANRQWKLLTATTVDGENEMFPVAFSVVEAGTTDNWNWFLGQLKSSLAAVSDTLTFISNGKHGLEEELPRVFEDSHHGYCVQQLIEDFKSKFEDSYTDEVKDNLINNLRRAVSACKVEEFNECVDSIKMESKELAEWVLASKPERWSDAYFKGSRCGHYSSNVVETLNSWLVSRHPPPVVQMVDMIRCKLMEMIYTRRVTAGTWTEALTPSANQKVHEEMSKSRNLDIICSTGSVFEVRDEHDDSISVVNIENWECTCRRWQVIGLPCLHAIAVFEQTNGCVYDYCSKYFTADSYRITYSSSINPIPDAGKIECIDPEQGDIMCLSRVRRPVGRPKVKPADPRIRTKRGIRCSRCKTYGHNKKTCEAVV